MIYLKENQSATTQKGKCNVGYIILVRGRIFAALIIIQYDKNDDQEPEVT